MVKQILTLTTTETPVMAMLTKQTTEMTENQELRAHSVRLAVKRTTLERKAILDLMQQIDHHFGTARQWDRIRINERTHRAMQNKMTRLRPQT